MNEEIVVRFFSFVVQAVVLGSGVWVGDADGGGGRRTRTRSLWAGGGGGDAGTETIVVGEPVFDLGNQHGSVVLSSPFIDTLCLPVLQI